MKQITKKHIAEFKRQINAWKWTGKDKPDTSMLACYACDRRQLTEVLTAVENGDLKVAARLANDLDTIVRDQIPADLHDVLFEEYA